MSPVTTTAATAAVQNPQSTEMTGKIDPPTVALFNLGADTVRFLTLPRAHVIQRSLPLAVEVNC